MGLFGKKKTTPTSFSAQPNSSVGYQYNFKKCRGYLGGEFVEFWAIASIRTPSGVHETGTFGLGIPSTHKGLPVRVILSGAIRGKRVNLGDAYNLVAVSANQGDSYGGPYPYFMTTNDVNGARWNGAVFTFDERHAVFAPLSPSSQDVTYGLVSIYKPKYGTQDTKWLQEQLKGDGKHIGDLNGSLFSPVRPLYMQVGGDKDRVDWTSNCRFLVHDIEKYGYSLAFIVTEERSTQTYNASGFPIS